MHNNLILATMFIIASACMGLVFIIFWLKNLRETKPFLRVGMTFVLILFLAEATAIYMIGIDSIGKSLHWILLLVSMTAVRTYAYTVGGLLLARRLNDVHMQAASSGYTGSQQTSYGAFVPSMHAVFYALLAVVFMLLYSTILFQLSDAKIGAALQGKLDLSLGASPVSLLAVATVGFSEELIFRLGLQNGLAYVWRSARYGHHWAVLATAAFWSAGHIGSIDPDWVKIAQIFVFGLLLGQMNRRFGVVPCILTHSLFNVIMVMLVPTIFGDGIIPT